MASDAGQPERRRGSAIARVAALMVLAGIAVPTVAQAQFFWEQPRFSPDDAARVAIQHGYRVLARPVRNDDVYVADVIDRRGARTQLIIATQTGQILQRYHVDARRVYRPYDDPSIPPGPIPPARVPQEDRHPGFFARLFGGDDDQQREEAAPQTDRPFIVPDQPVRPLRPRRPRLVEQVPGTVRQTPIESEPLAPPSAAPRISPPRQVTRPPSEAALPPASASPNPTPAPSGPARSISRNPLAIPGSREQDEKAAKAIPAPASQGATKPATPAPANGAVPVAPLE